MHCKHINGFSLVLTNSFGFLPHLLQQQCLVSNCFFVVLKNIFLFDVATIPNPSSSANNLSDSCTSLLFFSRAFFSLMINSTLSISSTDLMASICSWKVLFTSGLLLELICSLKKFFRQLFAVKLLLPWIVSVESEKKMDGYNQPGTFRGGWGIY
jgi:hypothetical protein